MIPAAKAAERTNRPHGRNYTADPLCSSCDRCRTKKVKCDGNRPCEACKISHMRENKIASMKEAELIGIECVYSPAKKRGPPPKRMNDADTENEGHVQDKKHRMESEEQRTVMRRRQVSREREIPSYTVNHNNVDAASILNLMAVNPSSFMSTQDFLQNYQSGNSLMYSPIDPMSAALQQSILSSLGNALGTQVMTMDQGLGRAASASRGHDIVSNAPRTATQQLAHLQQLLQQLELQQCLQQQLQLPPTEQGQTRAESPISSAAVEDERTQSQSQSQSLQSEVERLRRRVKELEAENVSLKQKLILLLQMKERENKDKD
jgi:hypothetical protein